VIEKAVVELRNQANRDSVIFAKLDPIVIQGDKKGIEMNVNDKDEEDNEIKEPDVLPAKRPLGGKSLVSKKTPFKGKTTAAAYNVTYKYDNEAFKNISIEIKDDAFCKIRKEIDD
jgi:hypothetical protein